ncbi:hypothetical protein [Nonomuraea bangladeshensis]|uniref:hypothetical protein n=1 Tax=Nonomuraea bangladeshensis TaxID=404385 RepID=UPI003C2EC4C2
MPEIPVEAVQAAAEVLERRDFTDKTFAGYARAALEAALEVLTPSEMIRLLMPSARWGNPEWPKVVEVLAKEGFAVVSVKDLRQAADVIEAVNDPYRYLAEEPELLDRLRAALPEEG